MRRTLLASVAAGIGILLTLPTSAQPVSVSPAFIQGNADRQSWETWYNGLSGEYQAGALFWAGQRSLPHPAPCQTQGGRDLGAWTAGCMAAQQRLALTDVRRKGEPDYRLGWNAWSQTAAPPPAVAYVPSVPTAPTPPLRLDNPVQRDAGVQRAPGIEVVPNGSSWDPVKQQWITPDGMIYIPATKEWRKPAAPVDVDAVANDASPEVLFGLVCTAMDQSATDGDAKDVDLSIAVLKTKPISAFIRFSETHMGQAESVEWHQAQDGGVLKLDYHWTTWRVQGLVMLPLGDATFFFSNAATQHANQMTGHCKMISSDYKVLN